MFVLFVSEIPSLLNLSPFKTREQTLEEVRNRYLATKYIRTEPWPTDLHLPLPPELPGDEHEVLLTITRQIVKGLHVRGRATLTVDAHPVVMRNRTPANAMHIFNDDHEVCLWYAWLFGSDRCIYEISVRDEKHTIIEREIERDMEHIEASMLELVKILNTVLIPETSKKVILIPGIEEEPNDNEGDDDESDEEQDVAQDENAKIIVNLI